MLITIKNYLIILLLSTLFSCTSYKPIFDKNQKFVDSGEDQSSQDFEICKHQAEQHLDRYRKQKIANEIKRKAVMGTVVGGLSGLIFGNSTKSVISGLAGGALIGGAYGGLSSYGEDKVKPDEVKQRLITRCLNQRGYEIIGWY